MSLLRNIFGYYYSKLFLLKKNKQNRIGLAMDAWMWPLKDDIQLAETIQQPILFINSANFQTRFSLKIMKRFTIDKQKRHVVTIK